MKRALTALGRLLRHGGLLLMVGWLLYGCATATLPSEPRIASFRAAPQQVLKATQATLIEQGFVILHGDRALGRLTAEYPRRPPLTLNARVSAQVGGTLLSVTAHSGSQALAPPELDNLMTAIHERLGEGVFGHPGSDVVQ
ncbi:hypothetical protein C7446_2811 [Kushneria sinocarnis]|uniref:Uncharacterized protein n=1 Tax=Kushneria sinocarnis TaxID=595502 RepID=A0A420WU41_9GAMM|nr:hypothetical protein [Kushneria sinocarnis]RKQ96950.1 hypothetical protein C7446_2811 [Kushneria sinocarnis]